MTALKIGSLFSGYRGLDMAVEMVTGGRTVWVSDIDPGACAILAHHWPEVPNLGDVSAVDFADVEPVDIITGGFPCQDVSHAGRRRGLKRGETRTGLWAQMCRAVDTIRPRLVVFENVRGLLSADADSDVERCPWCMGDDETGHVRALGAVLADLADIGYDARWFCIRASEVGACHDRFRVFGAAYSAGTEDDLASLVVPTFQDPRLIVRGALLATPDTMPEAPNANANRRGGKTQGLGNQLAGLPTPGAYDGSRGGSQAPAKRKRGGHSVSTADVIENLPTPTASSVERAERTSPKSGGQALGFVVDSLLPTVKATNNENRQSKTSTFKATNLGEQLGITPLLPTPDVSSQQRSDAAHASGAHQVSIQDLPNLLPTPTGWEQRSDPETDDRALLPLEVQRMGGALLPTPNDFHLQNTESPEEWLERRADVEDRTGTRHGPALPVVLESVAEGRPLVQDGTGPRLASATESSPWGPYAAAVHRHEVVFGRSAPAPTIPGSRPGKDGTIRARLNPQFTEWMMGLPLGHVTDPGIWADLKNKRGQSLSAESIRGMQLKACGNGVVPLQGAAALYVMLTAPSIGDES